MATEVGSPTSGSGDQTDVISVSRTVTSGSKGLSVQLLYYNGSGSVNAPTLSRDGQTFTKLSADSGTDYRGAVYFLANPNAGTAAVTGTFSHWNVYHKIIVREWSDVDSARSGVSANGDSATPTVNVTDVVSGEVILDAVCCGGQSGALTPGAGQSTTGLFNGQIISSIYGAASEDTTSTGATVASSYTISSSGWGIAAMVLTPTVSTRRAMISWAELEVPNTTARAQISWAELEVPDYTLRRAAVSWAELEVPGAPSRAMVSWAEMEVPDVGSSERRRLIGWRWFRNQ